MAYSLKKMRDMASERGACIEKTEDGYEVYFFSDHISCMCDNLNDVRAFLLNGRESIKVVNGVYEEEEHTGLEIIKYW
jgi:hypothetical protein